MYLLSKNFTLEEMTKSATMDAFNRRAVTVPLTNKPDEVQKANLRHLCEHYLQPLRDKYGPVFINSGFRTSTVNKMVGGARDSYHLQGLAADIRANSWLEGFQFAGFFIERFNMMGMGFHELILSQNAKSKSRSCFPPVRNPSADFSKILTTPVTDAYILSLFCLTMSYNSCCLLSICKINDFNPTLTL